MAHKSSHRIVAFATSLALWDGAARAEISVEVEIHSSNRSALC
jgi:hypothetical protein